MSRYTPPNPKQFASELPKGVSKRWSVLWNVLLTLVALLIFGMIAWNKWLGIPIMVFVPAIYFCFIKEDAARRSEHKAPRPNLKHQLRVILMACLAVSFIHVL